MFYQRTKGWVDEVALALCLRLPMEDISGHSHVHVEGNRLGR